MHVHAHDHHVARPGHGHAPHDFSRAFLIGIVINTGFAGAEAAVGLWTRSMALVADAGHNLSDVVGLVLAWGGARLAKRPRSARFTYGLRGSTILAALLNSLLLMVALGAIMLEAVQRIMNPPPVPGMTVIVVAALGVAVNLGTALLFARGRAHDLNVRGAFLHMAADAGVSAGVALAGVLILVTGAAWIDPAASLIVAVIILLNGWGLMKEALALSLAGVPQRIALDEVAGTLGALPGVVAVHDLHVWSMSTTETVLTAHLVVPDGSGDDAFLRRAADLLQERFGIGHVTLQVERGHDCSVGCSCG